MSRHSLDSLEQPHESPGFAAPGVARNIILTFSSPDVAKNINLTFSSPGVAKIYNSNFRQRVIT